MDFSRENFIPFPRRVTCYDKAHALLVSLVSISSDLRHSISFETVLELVVRAAVDVIEGGTLTSLRPVVSTLSCV